MTTEFRLVETTMSPLWSHGWFDLSRFECVDPPGEPSDAGRLLDEFLRDPISQRTFCTPGPWGEPCGHHGPFRHGTLSSEYCRPMSNPELERRVLAALDDPEFAEPPVYEQREPVERWIGAVTARGDALFALEPAGAERVDFDFVWLRFHEFIAVDPNGREISVAVIGYD